MTIFPEQDRDGGELDEACGVGRELVVAAGDAAEPLRLVEEALDGLIANDKFCLTHTDLLRLSWPRARVGPRVSCTSERSRQVRPRRCWPVAATTVLRRTCHMGAGSTGTLGLGASAIADIFCWQAGMS